MGAGQMNVAEAAALLAARAAAGDGNLPFVVATAESKEGFTYEEVTDIAPLTSQPPPPGGTWGDEADPGEPHTAVAAI